MPCVADIVHDRWQAGESAKVKARGCGHCPLHYARTHFSRGGTSGSQPPGLRWDSSVSCSASGAIVPMPGAAPGLSSLMRGISGAAIVGTSVAKGTAVLMNDDPSIRSTLPHLEFDNLVTLYYEGLYRFAFSLTRSEADALDLTQQAFYTWATKGGQLRDELRVKSWLFTTLHRAFLQTCRRATRFPHCELSEVEFELPSTDPERASQLDSASVLEALGRVDERYQAPVAMFYLENFPYKEIALILEVPLGTVKSRIARGLNQLHNLLTNPPLARPDGRLAA
jgi:RNA polymerase sigma-70 factor, ECF subfamily